jgi:hypothetical protein
MPDFISLQNAIILQHKKNDDFFFFVDYTTSLFKNESIVAL